VPALSDGVPVSKGEQDGKAQVRNQCRKTSQETTTSSNLADEGRVAVCIGASAQRTPWPVDVAGWEATVKVCGIAVARPQGHGWAPTPSIGSRVNVGAISAVPSLASSQLTDGEARRRLMLPGWGGGPVSSPRPGTPATWRRGPAGTQQTCIGWRSLVNTGAPWPSKKRPNSLVPVVGFRTFRALYAGGLSWLRLRLFATAMAFTPKEQARLSLCSARTRTY
jgi:hypothetical protein